MMAVNLLWLFIWTITVCAVDGPVMFNTWFVDENHASENENPSRVTAKIGDNLTIPCPMDYNLTFFAWFFCQGDCRSPKAKWKIVVKWDHGNKKVFNQQKFGLEPNGSLILKNIQPGNNNNWVKCKYKKPKEYMDHRSTIIRVAQESPTITLKSVQEHVVFENMPLFLECDAQGYPVPWIAWIWNDQVLQNNTNGPKYLLRRRATTKEAGNYICKAGNSAGITTYNYQVIVRSDQPPQQSKAPPGTHSTVERPTVESKATQEAPSSDDALDWKTAFWVSVAVNIVLVIAGIVYIVYKFKRNQYCREIIEPNARRDEGILMKLGNKLWKSNC